MTRHEIRLVLRPLPWPIRWWRRLTWPQAGTFTAMTSAPHADLWFAALVPYRARSAHRWWANRRRYFWLPCPLCGKPYGAHEGRDIRGRISTVPDPLGSANMSVGICPPCTRHGRGVPLDLLHPHNTGEDVD